MPCQDVRLGNRDGVLGEFDIEIEYEFCDR
jgi:hypothetical protein